MVPQFSLDSLQTPIVVYPLIAALLGTVVGWLAARARRENVVRVGVPRNDASDRNDEVRDLRKTVYLLQNDNRNLSTFLMTLPDLARQLNSNAEKRKIPRLLISFIEQLFDAEQILIFLTAQDGRHLLLAGSKGARTHSREQAIVPIGEGRIGWVAEHQITMDESDFHHKAKVERANLGGNRSRTFRTELCAPMISNGRTLGVISLGGLLRRPKNEKNMLKMVADLGSIAIQNTLMFNTIQESANSDGLTGLFNKRYFMDRLAEEILKAEKQQKPLSLFLFDIDHFKTYNDTNGHLAGDEALRISGRLIRETIRQDDLAARYGGEEFVLLLPDTDRDGALRAAEKLRKTVESFEYPNESSQPSGRVTISGGVATFPHDAKNTGDLIRCADQALYLGKRSGRNRVLAHETRYLSDDPGETAQPSVQTMTQNREIDEPQG